MKTLYFQIRVDEIQIRLILTLKKFPLKEFHDDRKGKKYENNTFVKNNF